MNLQRNPSRSSRPIYPHSPPLPILYSAPAIRCCIWISKVVPIRVCRVASCCINVLLHDGYGLPVHSVVILLRPRADRGDLTGTLSYKARPGRGYLDFVFEVIRLWQVPVERLLSSGLGTLPLAVLGQMPAGRTVDEVLPEVVPRLVERIDAEAQPGQGPILLTASFVLTGLRVSQQRVIELFQGVRKMREST